MDSPARKRSLFSLMATLLVVLPSVVALCSPVTEKHINEVNGLFSRTASRRLRRSGSVRKDSTQGRVRDEQEVDRAFSLARRGWGKMGLNRSHLRISRSRSGRRNRRLFSRQGCLSLRSGVTGRLVLYETVTPRRRRGKVQERVQPLAVCGQGCRKLLQLSRYKGGLSAEQHLFSCQRKCNAR